MDAILSGRPSAEERLRQYKPGSIYRVRLQNFLTYADVEFYPGPRLNVVIGPNGTGKSTLLCAICLGLGGDPPLLGRADDARTFIMHEKDLAVIEIELAPHWDDNAKAQGDEPKATHVVRRTIDRHKGTERGRGKGASAFFINGEKSNKKDVMRLAQEKYHIAIENLCTFLPQDKVGSFSGFDSKMLLMETEKSLSGSKHMYDTHMNLIDLEKEIRTSGSSVDTIADKLKRLEAENEQLEREKELMEERKKAEEEIELLEQKKAWLAFDAKRVEATELKAARNEAKKDLEAAKRSCNPLQDALGQVSTEVERMKSRRAGLEKDMQRSSKAYEKGLKKAEKCSDDVEEEMSSLNSIDAELRKEARKVEAQRAKVEQIEGQFAEFPPADEIERELSKASGDYREAKARYAQVKKAAQAVTHELKDLRHRADRAEKKLAQLNDEKAQRKNRIFRQQPNLGKTYQWIDQNRKMFRRPVWGPIVCEITDVSNGNIAAYLEQHVPNAKLKSYIVECEEDYNLLYNEVRTKRGMAINIVRVDNGAISPPKRPFPEAKMAMLKRDHGIICYLDEAVSAPDVVMQALRTNAQIDSVLVGSTKTQESLDRRGLMDILTQREDGTRKGACVFTCHHNRSFKYTSQQSRYANNSYMRVDEINPARMLAKGQDPDAIRSLQQDIAELDDQIKSLSPREDEESARLNEVTREGQAVKLRLDEAKSAKTNLGNIQNKLNVARRKLRDLEENASKDTAAQKNAIVAQLKKYIVGNIKANEDAVTQHGALMKATHTLAGIKMTEEGFSEKQRKLKDALYEKEAESEALETRLEQLMADFKVAKSELQELKKRAEEIAPMTDELKETMEALPPTLEEVEALLEEALSKVNSITDNPEVLALYEERKTEIADTRAELENLNEASDAKRTQLDSMRIPWETALVNTLNQVNSLFEKYMSQLGCAGAVQLNKGQGDGKGDFEHWGVEIKVKFREKSSLQVLSAQTHSGGERSVSTIMYLMALQDLMVSPFRCVDEINQGLDERNERLVFKRIVENSTKEPNKPGIPNSHCGQYFLITPKLLPNLTDMENEDVTVLCIFNGPYNFRHFSDWNVDKFLQSKKRALSEGGSDGEEEEYAPGKDPADREEKENLENAVAEGEEEEEEEEVEEEVPRKRRGGGGKKKKRKVEM